VRPRFPCVSIKNKNKDFLVPKNGGKVFVFMYIVALCNHQTDARDCTFSMGVAGLWDVRTRFIDELIIDFQ
jgi:hypothetical protein